MPIYETVFIARPDLSDKQVKDLSDKFQKIITDDKGKIIKTENWGLRSLAYPIKKSTKGHYVLIESDAPGATLIELERLLRLDEDILRSLTIRLDSQSEGPSALLAEDKDEQDKKSKDKKEAA